MEREQILATVNSLPSIPDNHWPIKPNEKFSGREGYTSFELTRRFRVWLDESIISFWQLRVFGQEPEKILQSFIKVLGRPKDTKALPDGLTVIYYWPLTT